LQSSALPLGHAAVRDKQSPLFDATSQRAKRVLVLSNGHGEDLIALRVLEQIHRLRPELNLLVLPLVGEGKIFRGPVEDGWLLQVGPKAILPSGGFSNQNVKALIRDVFSGLFQVSINQWKLTRKISKKGCFIIAVGDFLPLFFAWSSGSRFGFIGTPKSDYTWSSGPGFSISDFYHRLKGTEWDPWEWLLMSSKKCKLVIVRDKLTARGLRNKGIESLSFGNPMMDGFLEKPLPEFLINYRRLIILCGSRYREALINFERLIKACEKIDSNQPLALLVAVGSEPKVSTLNEVLEKLGYIKRTINAINFEVQSCWVKNNNLILIGPGQFKNWALWAEIGLATAGTATEQLVGLGISALSLPGKGPQFNSAFAKRQSRLLGGAVIPCKNKMIFESRLKDLLDNSDLRKKFGKIGVKRMGPQGGSVQIAKKFIQFF
tara:strand:+ start:457 stop:1758 length:1302 start_codon:yes stop_codon:yes gene_type:complete